MKSLLIAIKEEHLSKGIALALMDYFPRIYNTKNPYEAIEIIKNDNVDIIITELNFNTIEAKEYFEKISKNVKEKCNVIILYDDSIDVSKFNLLPNMMVEPKPISIKKIINIINTIKINFV